MKNLELLLLNVKQRIYERSQFFLNEIMMGNIFLFALSTGAYFWLEGMFLEYAKTKNMHSIFPFLMMIIAASFMTVSLLNISRTILAFIKMKWFKHPSLRFTIFYSYDFIDIIKLSKEENKQLFEIPLTKECLLYLSKRIEEVRHLEHGDLQYVYQKMKVSVITEDDTLVIEKVKEFFDKNDINVNTIANITDNKVIQHTQLMNGKKDFKKIL